MDYKKIGVLLAIGLIILIAMIMFIGPDQILSALQTANMNYVLLAIVVQIIILALWNTRWSIICKSLNIPHKQLPLFAMTIIGLAINDLTPSGRSGGEPVRAYLLSKSSNEDFKRTFASVMGDKIFDTFPFMVLAIFAIAYLMLYLHLSASLFSLLLISLLLFIIALLFIILLCFNEAIALSTVKWVFRQIKRFTNKVDKYEETALTSLLGFQNSLKYLLSNKRLLIVASAISFLVWFLELLRVYIVFMAFGVNVSLGMIAAVFLVSSLIGIIPLLPGGLGSIDGVMILLYSMAGISASVSTAATLIERMISLWMVLILGVILLPFFGTGVLDQVE
ncbi:UPF0104 family protein [Methanosphaera sp. ISO3-F5]|uniref:UPF0104 family protein n=1 Tax=Methanosphaera sp. ISO3-F5 TaxID=1452353 RepID=UPI002B26292D|nr:UPF0104 family protein [Methanosphaera sp. ISO3-F5]WQH64815.1 UPF0104 family protein [Methanosphaera sp. ISO3-F5]